jgi:CMP-2-keto-3-deoxyoctulosonic acid synthetase
MTIGVSYVNNVALSVDTQEDLIKVQNIIKGNG